MTLKRIIGWLAIVSLILSTGSPGTACGPWFPRQYLAGGGKPLLETPEFFAEFEAKLLAREFPTPFKAVCDAHPQQRNAERDLAEFDAAIKGGSMRPPDPAAAREAHRRMRNALEQLAGLTADAAAALPADLFDGLSKQEFPSEFADYHAGVVAYGRGDHAQARGAWERLLARPEKERRYRSVNAAFMIGILDCVDNLDEASHWLGMARELAQKGLHDASGLAAASYSWEAQWLGQRGQLHAAAECALRSVASGYPGGNFVEPKDDFPEELAKFATDPLLRRTHTGLLLADFASDSAQNETRERKFGAWLSALEAAGIQDFAGAERVAWMCYSQADYAAAKRWLRRAPAGSAEGLWLQGKLAARDGRREEALRAFAKAARILGERVEPNLEITQERPEADTADGIFCGEHGIVALGAGEFQTALEAFLRGGHWVDAAYVAERLLTVEELKSWISKRPWKTEWDRLSGEQLNAKDKPPAAATDPEAEPYQWELAETRMLPESVRTRQLRWLLARRLARLGRLNEARPFFPVKERAELDAYAAGLLRGRDETRPRTVRAMALWEAALEARYHGIELLGTEAAPDWFAYDGDFEDDDPAAIRAEREHPRAADGEKTGTLTAALEAGRAERIRLKNSEVAPDKRWHYRYRAAELAWQAAGLLPDNDRRLAEVLDLGGRWLASRDEQAADRFYQAIEHRCTATEIGQRALAGRWFVEIEDYSIPRRPKELK